MSQSKVELPGALMGYPRLSPVDETVVVLWFPIELLFREDPVRRFGQMAGDGPDSLLVAFAPGDALVEASDVAVRRPAAIEADGVRGFNEGPLEVAVDVGAGRTEARLSTAGVDARRRARIGGQLLGGGEACDVADLEGDHHGEREPHARQGQQALNRRGWLEHGPEPLLELTHLVVQPLDLLEQVLGGVRRTGGQELEALPQEGAAPSAEEVADLEV